MAEEKKEYTVYHQAGFQTTVLGHGRYQTLMKRPEWSDEKFDNPRPLTAGTPAQPSSMSDQADKARQADELDKAHRRNEELEARLVRLEAALTARGPQDSGVPTPGLREASQGVSAPGVQASAAVRSKK